MEALRVYSTQAVQQSILSLNPPRTKADSLWISVSGPRNVPLQNALRISSSEPFHHRNVRGINLRLHRVSPSASGRADEVASSTALSEESEAAGIVNEGLELFKSGKVEAALAKFNAALQMQPSPEEWQAAMYNKACCHAARGQGKEAQNALRETLGKSDLAFSVIMRDADMAPFRSLPEYQELYEEARKGGKEIGGGLRRDLKLISEVQAPFRGVRKFLYLGLLAAAGISTLFTLPRIGPAFRGGEGAPPFPDTLANLAINIGGAVLFVLLFRWEQRKEEEQIVRVSRDETLSRLPLRLGTNRIVEIAQLRETSRPVIIAGAKESVERAKKSFERYRPDLMARGVLLIPVVWRESSPGIKGREKKGFGGQSGTATSAEPLLPSEMDDFEKKAQAVTRRKISNIERKSLGMPVAPAEWELWLREQQEAEGVPAGEDIFIVLRLDGRLRKSGRGMPDWGQLVNELPPLESIVSKLER